MAQTTLIPKAYSQREFIDNTKKSQKVLINAQSSIVNINKILKERTDTREKVKSKIIENKRRREFLTRRQESEDELESKSIISGANIGGIVNLVSSSGKSFIGRIVQSLGYLAAGWILRNLPTWTGMAKEFIARLQEAGKIIQSTVTNAINIFQSSFRVISSLSENLKNFDLFDSSNKVRGSFDELVRSINDMGSEIEAGVKLITTPLTQTMEDGRQVGSYSGQEVPALGSTSSDMGAYADSSPSSGGSSNNAVYGTKEERALLDALAFAEGTESSYGTMFGSTINKDLESGKLTVKQVIDLGDEHARKNRQSGATGRYQFMPPTLEMLVNLGVLKMDDKFTPQMQDKAALALVKRRGVTADMLAKEGLSAKVSNMLAPEWASFPTYSGASYWGQPVKNLKSLQNVYKQSLGTTSQQSQTSSSSSPSSSTSTSTQATIQGGLTGSTFLLPAGAQGADPNVGATDRFGWSSWRGRHHNGIDIGTTGQRGYYVAFLRDGTATIIPNYGNAGNTVVIKSGGTTYKFLHLANFSIKSGPYKAGTVIGEVGNTGTLGRATDIHLHYEVHPPGTNGVNPEPYLNLIVIGKNLGNVTRTAQPSSSSSTQTSSSPTRAISVGTMKLMPQTGPGGFIQGGSGSKGEAQYATHFHIDAKTSNPTAEQLANIREVSFQAVKAMLARGSEVFFGNLKQYASTSDNTLRNQIAAEQRAHSARSSAAVDIQEINPNVKRTFPSQPGSSTKFPFAVGEIYFRGGYGREAEIIGSNGITVSHGAAGSSASQISSATPAAEITQTPSQQSGQQLAQQITPERKAQDIVAIIPNQQVQSTPQMGYQPPISMMKSGPSMTTVLNNFMKQKLLLELAYV
jgi:murein DD-endopeptidase MepM/ murein hydrolase activator NlpD